jgi:hypothetical protein
MKISGRIATTASAAGAAAALVLTAGGHAAATTSQSFRLAAHGQSEHNIDLGQKGFSAGDYDVHSDRLTHAGKRVGWDVGTCLTNSVTRTRAVQTCEFVLHLGKGELDARGAIASGPAGPGTFSLAIVGGTGQYRDATGVLRVTTSNTNSVPLVVDVRY